MSIQTYILTTRQTHDHIHTTHYVFALSLQLVGALPKLLYCTVSPISWSFTKITSVQLYNLMPMHTALPRQQCTFTIP